MPAVNGRTPSTITVTSPAFEPGQPIPTKHTGDGSDLSVPLRWTGVPEGARSLVLLCDDADAPTPEPWVHWVIYNLPGDLGSLPEGMPRQAEPLDPPGALQGKNSWPSNNIGYRGPAPPKGHGQHHYSFRLYALDTILDLSAGADKPTVLKAVEGRVIGQGELVGTYER